MAAPFKTAGTGFIVGGNNELAVLTAAHVFVETTNKIFPPARHAIPGPEFDAEDFFKRFQRAIDGDYFRAIYEPAAAAPAMFAPIRAISLNSDHTANDTALVQLEIPLPLKGLPIPCLWMDTDPPIVGEVVALMGMPIVKIAINAYGQISDIDRALTAGAGRIIAFEQQAQGYNGAPMWRVDVPTIGGMSGGPVIRVRRRPIVSRYPSETPVAIGIVSRSRLSTWLLLNSPNAEQTWFSPLSSAIDDLDLDTGGGIIKMSDAIEKGILSTFQRHPDNRGIVLP